MDEETEQAKLEVTFTNGALDQLRDLASFLSIENDNLQAVIMKGIKVLELAKENNSDKVVTEGGGQKQIISLKDI